MRHAETAGIPRDTPWYKLTPAQQDWVINGSPQWKGQWTKQWFGVRRFFEYLESKAYKMHIRVLLSKYRSYTPCGTCGGARLKTDALLWRLGAKSAADAVLDPAQRFMPTGVNWSREQLEALPGLCVHDLMMLPIDRLRRFFDLLSHASPHPSPLPEGEGAKPVRAADSTPSPSGGGQGWGRWCNHPSQPPPTQTLQPPIRKPAARALHQCAPRARMA
jgi:excinuclease ABC subunit A